MESDQYIENTTSLLVTNGPNRYDLMMSMFEGKRLTFIDSDGPKWIGVIKGMMQTISGYIPELVSGDDSNAWLLYCENVSIVAGDHEVELDDGCLYLEYNSTTRRGTLSCRQIVDDAEHPDNLSFKWYMLA